MRKLTLTTVRTADMQEVTSMKMKTVDIEMQESERKLSAFRSELSELNSEKHKAQMRYERSLKKLPNGQWSRKHVHAS
jgi:hypothetical protein